MIMEKFLQMIKNTSVLGVIPARGGSKGIHKKNIKSLAGKPLIAWTIEEAKKSKYIDRLILSSEDQEIIEVAKKWGCEVPFTRPMELAQDDSPGVETVLHAIKILPEYDFVVLLQPTSPLRSVDDIDGCLEKCIEAKANSCVSVTEADKSPFWMYYLNDQDFLEPVIKTDENYNNRQELPKVYQLNGAVYIANTSWLINNKSFKSIYTVAYTMPKERSFDIDNDVDFKMSEMILKSL